MKMQIIFFGVFESLIIAGMLSTVVMCKVSINSVINFNFAVAYLIIMDGKRSAHCKYSMVTTMSVVNFGVMTAKLALFLIDEDIS